MITIIDYQLGNIASITNALEKLAIPYNVANDRDAVLAATALILPGVGTANQGMVHLREQKLDTILVSQVQKGVPLLGICLGMQLLFDSSEEGDTACLGLLEGTVKKFVTEEKIPHVGWNTVKKDVCTRLLQNVPENSYLYFVHSYYCNPKEKKIIKGITDYDGDFCSVVEKENIYGVQFHPEKSGDVGLRVLRNFWEVTLCK
jgi:glutamine amidotransferase